MLVSSTSKGGCESLESSGWMQYAKTHGNASLRPHMAYDTCPYGVCKRTGEFAAESASSGGGPDSYLGGGPDLRTTQD